MQTEPIEEEIVGGAVPRKGHIGRVVVGSVFVGLLIAVVLIAFPLAHSGENVITGTVLLSFALGWTALAAGSERWTDQPQRWARCGLGAHGDRWWIRGRCRVGGPREIRDAWPAGGCRRSPSSPALHGCGSPTVVLEPGLGEPSPMMSGWIAPDVARGTRVCVYDRAGRGWSESASGPEDGVQVATELHTLLDHAHVNGPYVLAGHSAGGAYVLNFAHLYPDQVAGVVLLDSMHPDQYTKLPGWSSFYANLRRTSVLFPSLARLGVARLAARSATSGLPPQARDEERAFNSTPRAARSLRDEAAELRTTLEQAGALTSLGARPLIVVTAARDAQRGWLPLQNDLATLSTNSIHRVFANATHSSLTEDKTEAGKAAQAVLDVVTAVRTDQPLAKS